MNTYKRYAVTTLVALLQIFSPNIYASEQENHAAKNDEHNEEKGIIKLTENQMKLAGIKVTTMQKQSVSASFKAPGEVMLNAYKTIKIAPRITAQIVKRHARLGDHVTTDQALVTLTSVEMAEAQSTLMVTHNEWQRVKRLGKNVVSGKRFSEARIAYSQAVSRVKAYGMQQTQIDKLLSPGSIMEADGTFQLTSSLDGRILSDEFIVGEQVEAGKELMVISDETVMWVEARITPDQVSLIHVGNSAQVEVNGNVLPAKVSQIHHTLDEKTRTQAVRMEIDNKNDTLHPGMFINAIIQGGDLVQVYLVPEPAVLRSQDGDWEVFIEQDEAGEFKSVEVELKNIIEGNAVIDGIKSGDRIVTQGAFFVQSELAKGGFEIHNH